MSQPLKNSQHGAVTLSEWPPRWLTPVPSDDVARGDGDDFRIFTEAVCRVTKDSVAADAGQLLVLRPWQRELFGHLLARRPDGRYRHRQALIGLPRKNGKSAIGAALGLFGLVLGPNGGEVYSAAADKEQARIVFGAAKRMVEMDPELSETLKTYRDVIEHPGTGSIYRVLSAEAYTKEGLNPHLVLFDEVHAQPTRELWDVMSLAMGARREPMLVGITTAGVRVDSTGGDSLCYGMYQHGQRVASGEVEDPSFFMAWWEPRDPAADHLDPESWREANPGFGDIVSEEDFASAVMRTPEPEFRTKRMNLFVTTSERWLPVGSWENIQDERPIPDGAKVVLGFDGSFSGDSTALIACEVGEGDSFPHLSVAGAWEKPQADDQNWRVDILDVEEAIRQACKRWNVVEIACDPYRWSRTISVLLDEGLPMVEFPQTASRMSPATARFYEAVTNAQLTHDGDPRLARHLGNATLKIDHRGQRLAKESKNSVRKIDLAVASVMALERAAWHQSKSQYDPLSSIY